MNVTYDKKIGDVFNDDKKLKRITNMELAKMIRRREKEIASFNSFWEFLINGLGKPHSLEDDKGTKDLGHYGVNLTDNYRLIIKPNCLNRSAEELKECKEVIIIGVRDYHGKNEQWLVP